MSYDVRPTNKARAALAKNFAGNWGPQPLAASPVAIDADLSELIATLASPPAAAQGGGAAKQPGSYLGRTIVYTQGWTVGAGGNSQRAFARYDHPILLDRVEVALTALTAANTTATLRIFSAGQYVEDPSSVTVDANNGWTPITEQDYYNSNGDLTFSFMSTDEQLRTLLPMKYLTDPQVSLAWNVDNSGATAIRFSVTVHARKLLGSPVEIPAIPQAKIAATVFTVGRATAPRPSSPPQFPSSVTVSIMQGGRPIDSKIIPWIALDGQLQRMVLVNAANGIFDPTLVPTY